MPGPRCSAIGTLVDRRSRYLRLIHLPDGHGSEQLLRAIDVVLGAIPAEALLTLTWDQGSEMALHDRIAERLAEGVYFTKVRATAPWHAPRKRSRAPGTLAGRISLHCPGGADFSSHAERRMLAEDARDLWAKRRRATVTGIEARLGSTTTERGRRVDQ